MSCDKLLLYCEASKDIINSDYFSTDYFSWMSPKNKEQKVQMYITNFLYKSIKILFTIEDAENQIFYRRITKSKNITTVKKCQPVLPCPTNDLF